MGTVAFHGIAITPGETTALRLVGARPVLLLPGRLDAALAGWLTIGRRMLARLAFRLIEEQPFTAELARKVASRLACRGRAGAPAAGRVEPVAQRLSVRCRRCAPTAGSLCRPTAKGYPAGTE